MPQQYETLVCPSCGNTNPYMADQCLRCGLSLGPIREAMAGIAQTQPASEQPGPVTRMPAIQEIAVPGPEIAEAAIRQMGMVTTASLGNHVSSWQAMIPGMADKMEIVAKVFLHQLCQRQLPGVIIGQGQLKPSTLSQPRDHWFIQRNLGWGSRATTAVCIMAFGERDLYVGWQHFERGLAALAQGGTEIYFGIAFVGAGLILSLVGAGLILIPIGIILIAHGTKKIKARLGGFQSQDSWMLSQAVDAALKEALDLVGIGKDLIQELPKGQRMI